MQPRLIPTFLFLVGFATGPAIAAEKSGAPQISLPGAPAAPAASQDSGAGAVPLAAYTAAGASFAKSSHLGELGWNESEFNAFLDGVRLAYRGQPVPAAQGTEQLFTAMTRRVAEIEARDRQRMFSDPKWLEAYMKDACKKFSLTRSDSGLAYAVVSKGKGVRPGPDDTVIVSANVTAADGATELPALKLDKQRVKVADLVPGLREGVQMMTLDSRGMFVVPPDLSYGNEAWPHGVERGSPLLFVLVLHEVIPGDPAP